MGLGTGGLEGGVLPDPLLISVGLVSAPGLGFVGNEKTGIYSPGADIFGIVADDVEAIRYTKVASAFIVESQSNVGLTADIGSSQGDGVITSSYNVYSTVGTAGDAATLPAVFGSGIRIFVKNDGAESMDVFPASGDDAGAGADTAIAIAAGSSATFIGTVANATWSQLIVGGGDVTKVGTPVDNQVAVFTGDGTIEGDTGFQWDGTNLEIFSGSGAIRGNIAAGGAILNETATDQNPTLIPNRAALDIGIGGDGANTLSLIISGIDGLKFADFSTGIIQVPESDVSVTAQAGGGQASAKVLINSYSVVDVVTTTGDSVKLPGTFFGSSIMFIKNDGVNACDVFPFLGDDLGQGTNVAESLAAGVGIAYIATATSSAWTRLF